MSGVEYVSVTSVCHFRHCCNLFVPWPKY